MSEKMQAEVDALNEKMPVGSNVILRKDDGTILESEIKYPFSILSGRSVVGWVKGVKGCYLADRIMPR